MFACTSIHGNEQKKRELTQKERKLRQKERERLLSIICYKSGGLAIAPTLASLARPRALPRPCSDLYILINWTLSFHDLLTNI